MGASAGGGGGGGGISQLIDPIGSSVMAGKQQQPYQRKPGAPGGMPMLSSIQSIPMAPLQQSAWVRQWGPQGQQQQPPFR